VPAIKIAHELGALRKELTKTRRTIIPKAAARALNRTGQQVQSAATKRVAKDMGIKQKDAKPAIKRSKATVLVKFVEITARGRPLNLMRFGARQTKKGVSAKPWGKRRIFKGAWIGNDGRTVFKRVGKSRQPIRGVYGPGIAKSFEDARPAAFKVFRDRWPVNFRDAMRSLMIKNKHLGHKGR
jgi:hypothetical protein